VSFLISWFSSTTTRMTSQISARCQDPFPVAFDTAALQILGYHNLLQSKRLEGFFRRAFGGEYKIAPIFGPQWGAPGTLLGIRQSCLA